MTSTKSLSDARDPGSHGAGQTADPVGALAVDQPDRQVGRGGRPGTCCGVSSVLSSTTRISAARPRSAADRRSTRVRTLAPSLNVGTITVVS